MALIAKRDVGVLLAAGFSEEELGLVDGGLQGVEIYETPDDYFAHELIDNAKEAGEVDLLDDPTAKDDTIRERYDTSHPGLYDNQEYAGNDDFTDDVSINLREQAKWLKTIKLGKMTIWQRRSKKGVFEWPVKNLKVVIPEEEKPRYNRLAKEDQKELWKAYARDEWKKLWHVVIDSLYEYEIVDRITFTTRSGSELSLLVVSVDNLRDMGYTNLPAEARWVTMIYFDKD